MIVRDDCPILHDLARCPFRGGFVGDNERRDGEAGDTKAANTLATLAAAVDRLTPGDGAHDTAIAELRLYRSSVPSELTAVVYEPSLCIVAQGSKEVRLGDENFRYDPAQCLLVSVDLPVAARVVEASPARPCLMLRVTIDPAVVGELLAERMAGPAPASLTRAMGVTPVDPPLLDAVTRLVTLLDAPRDIPPLAPLALREITYRVLTGPNGARLLQMASAGAPAQRIALAIRWLKDHFTAPLRIESLARHVRMSPSALHLHFKAVTAMSPLQYQKRLRLQEARRLMLGEGIDAAAAAVRVGYESPSQFSREYRRIFGAPPRRDIASLKVAPGKA